MSVCHIPSDKKGPGAHHLFPPTLEEEDNGLVNHTILFYLRILCAEGQRALRSASERGRCKSDWPCCCGVRTGLHLRHAWRVRHRSARSPLIRGVCSSLDLYLLHHVCVHEHLHVRARCCCTFLAHVFLTALLLQELLRCDH